MVEVSGITISMSGDNSSLTHLNGKKDRLLFTYTIKDIAEYNDMHYTTVSRAIKKIEREYERGYCKN